MKQTIIQNIGYVAIATALISIGALANEVVNIKEDTNLFWMGLYVDDRPPDPPPEITPFDYQVFQPVRHQQPGAGGQHVF